MAKFSDTTSSNGMSNNWVTTITYGTTAYAGYTVVEATLSLTVKYGWNFTLNQGYSLTINGSKVTGSGKVISQTDSGGNGVTYTLLTHRVEVSHTTNKVITISGSVDADNIYYKSGGYYVGTYSLSQDTTLIPLTTKCTAPTTFSVSPNNFESNITLSWSGATAGENNSIKYYYIQYAVSSNNATWGDWTGLKSIQSTSTSGSYTADMSSKVSMGCYVKFRIRTEGSAGASWYSAYKTSSSLRRRPYTACTAPSSFVITQNASISRGSATYLNLSWSGASGGTNNAINAYLIQYSVCSDNASFYTWTDLQTIATTQTSYSYLKLLSSEIKEGQYIKFRVRTQGTAGSSYYSNYIASNSLKPCNSCTNPTSITLKSEVDINNATHTDAFKNKVTLSWSGASGGLNNAIKRYYIEYCISSNNSTWSEWDSLQSSNLTPAGTSSTTVDVSAKVERGSYIKFRIRTEGEAGSTYYSPYLTSSSIRRNSIPETPTLTVAMPVSLEYSYGNIISLKWNKPTDADNNLNSYEISVRYTQNGIWSSWQVLNSSLTNTAYTFSRSDSIYSSIANNQKVQFRIRTKDVFGEYSSSYSTCSAITRYDTTGVSIGINGKWVNCQIYVGKNGNWVEQSVSAGINGAWIDADEGV